MSTTYDQQIGDLIMVPDGTGWILAIIDEIGPTVACWGDTRRVVEQFAGRVIFKQDVAPEIGKLIGRRFDSLELAAAELRPFRRLPATA